MLDWDNYSTWSVLLVDNEPDNVEVVTIALEFFGMTVKTAKDGVEGLEILQDFSPDLILLDLSMPEMDGWEMRTRVKADPSWQHIPIVALTAHAMSGDQERALDAGFDGYLVKPINIPTLLTDLRAALALARTPTQTTPEGPSQVGMAANPGPDHNREDGSDAHK
jgi:CheY-like chemotaxis protein